ncbi:MAG: hypothetical protein Q9217_000281 [Psora testacea]
MREAAPTYLDNMLVVLNRRTDLLNKEGTSKAQRNLDKTNQHGFKHEEMQLDTHSVEKDLRQQERQRNMQEMQQTTARPGHQQDIEYYQRSPQFQDTQQGSDRESGHDYLSIDDIHSLMAGLDPATTAQDDMHMNSTIDLLSTYNSITSADSVDLFRSGLDGPHEQDQTNDKKNMQTIPHSLPDTHANVDTQKPRRPSTPSNQTNKGYLPITPATTPFSHPKHIQHASFSRTAASSPTRKGADLTIKASHVMQRGKSCQDNFAAMRHHAMNTDPLSPPKTAPLQRRSVDFAVMPQANFLNLSDLKMDMPSSNGGYNPANYSPITNAMSSTMSSFKSSPEVTHMSLFDSVKVDDAVMNAKLSYFQASQGAMDIYGQSASTQDSSVTEAQSISEIDVEECIEQTGITVEEIASFIQGPFPDDSKWRCLYEEEPGIPCGKRFARKENAKSHVQTHLGDRQYVCKVCNTRFVRQHDLKRHFKIHTTDKPHKCPCGKDFHRHDALTRHRQRGMCSGAFESTPKKAIKRGRPKKQRPNTEERLEKAAKTRQYVMERTRPGSTYASSISGSSEYSHGSPPSFDNVSLAASSPSLSHRAFQGFSFANQTIGPMTPPTSPGYSTGNAYSSSHSQHSHTPKAASHSPSPKITTIPEELYELSGGVSESMKNSEVFYNSPPELDLSSSSPATSNFFDFGNCDGNTLGMSASNLKDDCLNPQFLNSDFPLFDGTSSKEGHGTTNFDDFFDLSGLTSSAEPPSQQKQDDGQSSKNSTLGHGSFAHVVDDPDDIFSGL